MGTRPRWSQGVDLTSSKNLLVRQLNGPDRERLAAHFEETPLAFKQTLFEQGERLQYLYFPEDGVISLITRLREGEAVETGTVGKEGVAGVSAVLGVTRAPGRAICQVPGRGLRLPERVIAEERERSSPWFLMLLRFVNFVTAMAAQSAACNRIHAVDARMSRWLLMMHDRVEGDTFLLTQEFLVLMLGVARPAVNIAGATLQRAGFIKYSRGRITVLDRAGLESASCECYRRIQEELEQTFNGHSPRHPGRRVRRS